jgi:TPR repeat protein
MGGSRAHGERRVTTRNSPTWTSAPLTAEHLGAVRNANLGMLLARQDQHAEAEDWHRRAAAAGHAGAMSSLGVLLARQGKDAEAEDWYRRAAAAGGRDR